MNQWMMMAMMIGMANRNNPAETVQTVLGASNALGEGGRMAVGLMRQQQVDTERVVAKRKADDRVKAIGKELHDLAHAIKEHHQLQLDLVGFPALAEAVKVALPDHGPIGPAAAATTAPAAGATHPGTNSVPRPVLVAIPPPPAATTPPAVPPATPPGSTPPTGGGTGTSATPPVPAPPAPTPP
jgi:hypothetical protein